MRRSSRAYRRPTLTSQPSSERIFNAPAVVVILAASLPALFWMQTQLPDRGLGLALQPASLWRGDGWPTLLTSMFIHGGWEHVALNAVGVLTFGPPVARLMSGSRGVVGFFGFYVAAGLIGAAGYALVHPDSLDALGGASGAVFGLVGAALRLLGRPRGRLGALTDRRFLMMAGVIMALNVVTGLVGLANISPGSRIAWEAHAFGFLAGALLIGPWARVFRSRPTSFDSSPDLRDPSA